MLGASLVLVSDTTRNTRHTAPVVYRITVITLVRESEPFLADAIDSVAIQRGVGTHFSLEHLFVYAASKDRSREIIESYRQRYPDRVRIVDDLSMSGIAHAMNLGAREATGDIIAYLHSDDLYDNDSVLSIAARTFERNNDLKWLYSSCKLINARGEVTRTVVRSFDRERLLRFCIVPHVCVFMKRQLFDEIGYFDTGYQCAMDYDYWLRLAPKYEPLVLSDRYFGRFRVHPQSTTERKAATSRGEEVAISLKYQRLAGVSEHVLEAQVASQEQVARAALELDGMDADGGRLILVDEDWFTSYRERHPHATLPFMEHDGAYWGWPTDDGEALRELHRLQGMGATRVAFTFNAFWCLDHYSRLREYLSTHARVVHRSGVLVVYEFV